MKDHKERFIYSFARRKGKTLTPNAKRLVRDLLPSLSIALPVQGQVDINALFPDAKAVRMEIGFGAGEHLLAQARAHPDIGFIGCEPFINGVAKLLADIEAHNISNIRLFTDDARLLCERLPPGSLEQIYILFPDPWRKPRHYKRRLISADTLNLLAGVQREGGRLLLATDHRDYSAWMLEVLLQHPDYTWQAETKADWQTPPPGWVNTRYQEKTTAEGREPVFLWAIRQ